MSLVAHPTVSYNHMSREPGVKRKLSALTIVVIMLVVCYGICPPFQQRVL